MKATYGLLLVLLLAAAPAIAGPTAQRKGDFFYDAEGRVVGSIHRDLPQGFERVAMSHKEQFELLGIKVPERPATLRPRAVSAKPAQLRIDKGVELDRIEVKFVEGIQVRMRSEGLTALGADLSRIHTMLAKYPEAQVRRLHSVSEKILDDNKDTGERISGQQLADLNNWYIVEFPGPSDRAIELASELLADPLVETAYFQEVSTTPDNCVDEAPPTTNYQAEQNYLNAAPDGVDAFYSWGYHAGGNGSGAGFYVIDCEWEWCYGHEDINVDAVDVVNGDTGHDQDSMNHGTAVLGVMGGCDNGFGVTGISSDVTLKLADRDSETSWGANIASADAILLTGEVMLLEVHISGPSSGLTCPCNCSQFEYVPVEYNQAAFDAIQTATANGTIVVEAGGNGSMNLDSAIYSSKFDINFRDSGAILVGAGTNNAHVPECFTDYGSRIDVHGYGDGVRTTGYGGGSSTQADCHQSYTAGFSGTSSASPMITGVCVDLQGIANAKYGYDLSASQMRNRIKVGATPQAASAKNIGPMPDLADAINGIEADVAEDFRAGWTSPIVGRVTNDANGSSAVIEAGAFPGNASGPYWSWATQNYSAYSPTVNSPHTRLYIDDIALFDCLHPNFAVLEARYCANLDQAGTVKGGRHTMRTFADYADVEQESSETNNEYYRQFIWTGLPLAADVQYTRTYDPPAITTGYSYYNAEGFSGTVSTIGNQAAFAVMPVNASDDFDIRLHNEVPANNPTAGFGASLAFSSDGAGLTDFVLVDTYEEPTGTYYAGVLNFSGTGSKVVEFELDEGLVSNPGTTGPFTLQSGDIMELHRVSLTSGVTYRITADVTSGSADIGLSLYPTTGTDGFWSKTQTEPGGYADNVLGTGDESVIVTPTSSGVYALAVWKVGSTERLLSVTYSIVVRNAGVDLASTTPAGWYGPVVPRNTTDASIGSAPLPATLTGNTTTTSYNFSTFNWGPEAAPGTPSWSTLLHVDDVSYWIGGRASDQPAGSFTYWINTAQGFNPNSLVRGGRHYVKTIADSDVEVTEYDETNNTFIDWFVWTPMALANQVPVTRSAPPNPTPLGYTYYAVDGFRTTPAASGQPYWTAVGIIPATASEDYDLRMYDASTGSKDGFGTNYAWSSDAAGLSDFSIVNYNAATRVARDYGVFKQFTGTGDFNVQRADGYVAGTVALTSPFTPTFGPYTIQAGDVLDFHEIYLPSTLAGVSMRMSLRIVSGNADLGIALYDGSTALNTKAGYLQNANSSGAGLGEETGLFSLASAGYYGLAVYKNGSSDLARQATYEIYFTRTGLVDVEDSAPTAFALTAGSPNPFSRSTTVQYTIPAQGGRVSLDVYGLDGRRVKTLVQRDAEPGQFTTTWDGRDDEGRLAAAGVYFLRFTGPGVDLSRRITFLP